MTWNNYPTFFSWDSWQEFQEAFWDGEGSRELVLKRKKERKGGEKEGVRREREERKRKIKEEKKKKGRKEKLEAQGQILEQMTS